MPRTALSILLECSTNILRQTIRRASFELGRGDIGAQLAQHVRVDSGAEQPAGDSELRNSIALTLRVLSLVNLIRFASIDLRSESTSSYPAELKCFCYHTKSSASAAT